LLVDPSEDREVCEQNIPPLSLGEANHDPDYPAA
jgi:hypothetical protein